MNHGWQDGGWKSRKFWFAMYATGLLFVGMKCSAQEAAMATLYGEFVGGLVGITLALLTGNIAGKWVAGNAKTPPGKPPKPSPPAPGGSAVDP